MPEIETSRLRLRLPTPDDLDDLAAVFADPVVMKFIGLEAGVTLSRAESATALEKMIAFWQQNGFGRWIVMEKERGIVIGLCGLRQFDDTPELFYLFEQASWGKGFAAEAASAVLRYAFKELQMERIIAGIRPGNTNSINVVNKIGMRPETESNPYGVDGLCYVATRAEFDLPESNETKPE